MPQGSAETPSSVGDVYLTSDGTADGIPLKWRLKGDGADWDPWLSDERATNEGAVVNDVWRSGTEGIDGFPLEFLAEYLPDVVKAALKAQAASRATLVAVDLTLAETDASGAEINLAFDTVKWVRAPVGATDYDFVGRTYEGVSWRMVAKE